MSLVVLEIDLGQAGVFNTITNKTVANPIKLTGVIKDNKINNGTNFDIELNKPVNNEFSVKKTGNTKDYMLILSFEEIEKKKVNFILPSSADKRIMPLPKIEKQKKPRKIKPPKPLLQQLKKVKKNKKNIYNDLYSYS